MSCTPITDASTFLDDEDESRRNLVHVVRYWDELRSGKRFPSENDICPSGVGELWENCYVIQKRDVHHPERGNYTYIGDNILNAYEMGLLDSATGRIIAPKDLSLNGMFAKVLEEGVALYEDDHFTDEKGAEVWFRQCFLPLATHGDAPDAIFGCLHFKVDGKKIEHARHMA